METITCLSFFSQSKMFVVNVDSINSVIHCDQVTPIPMSPSYVNGLMNLRGQIIPIFSFSSMFDDQVIERKLVDHKIIIIEIIYEKKNKIIGIEVDAVGSVFLSNNDSIISNVCDKSLSLGITNMIEYDEDIYPFVIFDDLICFDKLKDFYLEAV